jgi:hypothetical protein
MAYIPTGDHRDRLLQALKAVEAAGNTFIAESIRAALEGRPANHKLPSIHPEVDYLFDNDSF